MVRLGQGSYIGFGLIVQGSPFSYLTSVGVNSDIKLWFRSQEDTDNMEFGRDPVQFPEISTYDPDIEASIEGQQRVSGSLNFKLTYSYLQDILRIITGHDVDPTDTDADTNEDEYAFVPVEPNSSSHFMFGSVKRHLVIEVFRNDVSDRSVFYQGCVVTSFKLTYEPNGFLGCSMEFIGNDVTVSTKSTPVFKPNTMKTPTAQAPGTPFLQFATAAISSGALVTYRCTSASVTVNMPVEPRFDLADVAASAVPLQSGQRTVNLEMEIEATENDELWMNIGKNPITNRLSQVSLVLSDSPAAGVPRGLTTNVYNVTLTPPIEPRATGIGVIKAQINGVGHARLTTPIHKALEFVLALESDPAIGSYYYMTPTT